MLTHIILSLTYTQHFKVLHTHIALYCYLYVAPYFSFTAVTEIKNYQLKPRNNTLAEVYKALQLSYCLYGERRM